MERNSEDLNTPEKADTSKEEEKKLQDLDTPDAKPSEEDQRCLDMPRIINSGLIRKTQEQTNDILATLAQSLKKTSSLKDGADLEELRRKQEDLLLIQEIVQK